MLYCLMFLLVFISLWLCFSYKIKQIGLLTGVNIFAFFAEYVIISGFYFWADSFSVMRSLVTMLVCNVTLLAVLIFKFKKLSLDYEPVRFDLPLVIILLIAVPLSAYKFGYFGMGQDEGVYQVKAIDLMYTDTLRQKSFDEYFELDDANKSIYLKSVKSQLGYDIYDSNKPTLSESEKISDVDGIYHGIPTFSAILALSGFMFGLENMSMLNSLIYIGIILLMNYLCLNFFDNRVSRLASVMITALSPIVLWVTKSTLTELLLTLIVIAFLYFITNETSIFNALMSILCVWAFAFFHVSIYATIPYFIVCSMIMYLKSEKRMYFWVGSSYGILSVIGLCMMVYTSPQYTTNNIVWRIPAFLKVNDSNCVVAIALMIIIILCAFAVVVWAKPVKKILINFIANKIFSNIIRAICLLMIIVCGYNCIKTGTDFHAIAHAFKTNSLSAFAYMTGIVVLPAVLVMLIVKMHDLLGKLPSLLIVFSFFYNILFRCAFLNTTVNHYYYYSRYLAPYISIIAVLFGIIVTKKIVISILAVCSAGIMLPYDLAMFKTSDDARMEWETLLDVTDYISENDAVIISNNCLHTFFLPIKEITGAHVYPILNMDVFEQCDQLSERYDSVHILHIAEDPDYYSLNDKFVTEYSDTIHESQDEQQFRNKIIPLPYKFSQREYKINLIEYHKHTPKYFIPANDIIRSGFRSEPTFCWCIAENSEIFISSLTDDMMNAKIMFSNYIPFNKIGVNEFLVDVSVNGNLYKTIDLVSRNSITIPLYQDDMSENNGVYIQFKSDMWSPTQYGSSDTSKYGFALAGVTLSNMLSDSEIDVPLEKIKLREGSVYEDNKIKILLSNDEHLAFFGPYMSLTAGDYVLEIDLQCSTSNSDDIDTQSMGGIRLFHNNTQQTFCEIPITDEDLEDNMLTGSFTLEDEMDNLEIYLFTKPGVSYTINGIKVKKMIPERIES